jgi:hypothetical protein
VVHITPECPGFKGDGFVVRNGKNHNGDFARVTGYVAPGDKQYLVAEIKRAAKIEGVRDPKMGDYISRWSKYRLHFDHDSMREYAETHKRRRDEDPARD